MLPQYNLILNNYISYNPISKNIKHDIVRHWGSELQNNEFWKNKIQLTMKVLYLVLDDFLL